jgi:hypothetical protein
MLLLLSHTRRWMGPVCALWRRLSQRPRTGPEGVTAGQTGQTRLTIPRLDQTHRTSHPPSELMLASHRGCHPIHTKELWKPRGWKITPSEQPSTISMFALVWSSTSPPLHRFYRHLVLLLEAKDRSRHTRQSSSGAVYARTSGGYTVCAAPKSQTHSTQTSGTRPEHCKYLVPRSHLEVLEPVDLLDPTIKTQE